MEPEEVGKRVKAKYPQYSGMSDAEVGKLVIAKYPQYGKQKGVLEKITDFLVPRSKEFGKFVGSAALGAGSELYRQASNVTRGLGTGELSSNLAQVATKAAEKSNEIRQQQGTTGSFDQGTGWDTVGQGANITAGALGEVAAYGLPANPLLKSGSRAVRVAGGALQGLEAGGILGLTDPSAENLQERLTNAGSQGLTGLAVGGVLQGGIEGLGWTAEQVQKGVNSLRQKGLDAYATTFKDNIGSRNIIRRRGGADKFADDLIKYKIPKTRGGVQKEISKLNSQYEKEVTAKLATAPENATVDFGGAIEELKQQAAERYSLPDPQSQRSLKQALAYLDSFSQYQGEMNPKSANALRKQLDKTYSGVNLNEIRSGEKWANDMLANSLRRRVQDAAPITKNFFKKYSLLKDAEQIFYKEPKVGFNELLGALAGSSAFGPKGLIGAIGARAVKSPGATRTVASAVSRLPKVSFSGAPALPNTLRNAGLVNTMNALGRYRQ